jgi:hypothetical protein
MDVLMAGQHIRGRLLSVRDGVLTVGPDKGPRVTFNKFEVTSISEETRPISRLARNDRYFWTYFFFEGIYIGEK